jgi:hypothetical protein
MAMPQGGLGDAYQWVFDDHYKHVTCAKGPGAQTVNKLWEAEELTEFHDSELDRATKRINAIMDRIEKNNKDSERTLSLIEYQGRHFLVWATYGAITRYDDDETIIKAWKIKVNG